MRTFLLVSLLSAAALSGCSSTPPPACDPCPPVVESEGPADAVVVAVVDYAFDPYHYDFLASQMPQALDGRPVNDLPLDQDPATWLPGFPAASAFASYDALRLTLPDGPQAEPAALNEADMAAWEAVPQSGADGIHMRWIPGTKVVGFVDFAGDTGFAASSHGVGTTSVSVGNIHGACPECLLVFVNGPMEEANRWVEAQDWIDVQTNSWGISSLPSACTPPPPTPPPPPVPSQKCGVRDRVYSGSDTESQRTAIERGQSIFFSAGNGVFNDFYAPNPTFFSSQEGPDWIITVGAVTPTDKAAYSGAGKPVDIASIGRSYPSAGGANVTANATFSGTSNATPVVAGVYARALYEVRRELVGPSRMQVGGIVAQEHAPCDDTASCLPGKSVTVHEMRAALFAAANFTNPNMNAGGQATVPASTKETTFAAEGHGVLLGRLDGLEGLEMETEAIAQLIMGEREWPVPDLDEEEWFVADSYCRQGVWGSWEHGDYVASNTTLPSPDPQWPVRSFYVTGCPEVVRAVVDASQMIPGTV